MGELLKRAEVAREAVTWLGTPYHHHARIKGAGVDCAQLLIGVFEACGMVPAIDTGHYPVDWHMHRNEEIFSAWLAKYAARIEDAPPRTGDVYLFRWGRTFAHGAIYVGLPDMDLQGLLIHAYIKRGVILSRFDEDPLDGREFEHWSLWQ